MFTNNNELKVGFLALIAFLILYFGFNFLKGNDLAEGAAEVGLGVPKLRAKLGGLLINGLLGDERFDGDAEAFLDRGLQVECFGEEEAGVDCEDGKNQAV